MKSIPLTEGKFALVDDVDYEFLRQFKWTAFHRRKYGIVAICMTADGRRLRMPDVVISRMGFPGGVCFARNRNYLDCRRKNFFIADFSNQRVRRRQKAIYEKRKARAICTICEEPAVDGILHCEFHRELERLRWRERRRAKNVAGSNPAIVAAQ